MVIVVFFLVLEKFCHEVFSKKQYILLIINHPGKWLLNAPSKPAMQAENLTLHPEDYKNHMILEVMNNTIVVSFALNLSPIHKIEYFPSFFNLK